MKTCKESLCQNSAYARGLCSKHYQSWLKTAAPEDKRKRAANGSGTLRKDGYIQVRKPGHPTASVNGFAFEHRMLLWDKIGPGAHNCHYCSKSIMWHVDLECDHLDHNRSNNNLENLVPCCEECNRARWNREKTECPNGHGAYDKAYANRWRYCSKCKNEKEKRRRARMKQEKLNV